jgi:type VI secretion system secreted protein Hcp
MSFDAFCYSKVDKAQLVGETKDDSMKGMNAFEVLSFELGAENTINIGSISGGGGAGKATFKEFTVTKKTDTATTDLFKALVTGKHFQDLFVELRRSGQDATKSGGVFLRFEFALVMVQDISWSGSDGDDICEETVIFQYGAMKVQYYQQDAQGKMASEPKQMMWSRVKNNASMLV